MIGGYNIKKSIYMLVGLISLGIGFVAAIVPLLPAFPFLLIAALSFGRSSDKLYHWFISTKLYKNNLESYLLKKGMTFKAKRNLIVTVTLTMGLGFFMMHQVPIGQIILGVVWIAHLIYFLFGVKTINEEVECESC